jgi:mitochondrial import inner membrane translocase subunit TIM21
MAVASTTPPSSWCSTAGRLRSMSSQANNKQDDGNKNNNKNDGGNSTDNDGTNSDKEIVLTPGEQVVAVTRLSMWVGILGFACACAYYIGKELIPTKMSPNTVFNGACRIVKDDPNVKRQYGDSLKFYGRDHGGHREGRRNFIEHTQYTDPEDHSKRTRVRFNVEGKFASALCFAEVSNSMPSGEFVYVLVQDKQTGRVITVIDNRAALTAQRLAGGNTETAEAMKQLLSGGGGGGGGGGKGFGAGGQG